MVDCQVQQHIPNRYPLNKVQTGLIIKATIPRVPAFSLYNVRYLFVEIFGAKIHCDLGSLCFGVEHFPWCLAERCERNTSKPFSWGVLEVLLTPNHKEFERRSCRWLLIYRIPKGLARLHVWELKIKKNRDLSFPFWRTGSIGINKLIPDQTTPACCLQISCLPQLLYRCWSKTSCLLWWWDVDPEMTGIVPFSYYECDCDILVFQMYVFALTLTFRFLFCRLNISTACVTFRYFPHPKFW